jgi:hypothetical protein
MKTLFSIFILSILLPSGIFAQDMQPPPPIDNEYFNNSIGDWVADEYEMMGMKWTEETNVSWALGKQFLVITTKSKSDQGMIYESVGYMTMDKDKNTKLIFFDNWGYEGISEFTGKIEGNTATMEGGNNWMKSKGKMIVENNLMVNEMSFTMPGADGKEVTQDMKVVYKKK